MNVELVRIWKDAIVAYIKASGHSLDKLRKTKKASNPVDIQTRKLPYMNAKRSRKET
jgi:hypothetical protein